MATKVDPVSLVCKLCDKTYQHKDGPLMLPCLHSFCKPCLAEYIKKEPTPGNKMACPTCSDRFPLPKDINQFPVNLRLSRLAKATTYEKQVEGGNVKCQKCKGNPKDAMTFCCNHCKFLCDDCKSDYLHFTEDEDEEFIDLATCRREDFKVHSPPPKCPQHWEKMVIFCDDCKTLICLYCAQTKHQNHQKTLTNEAAEKEKLELQQLTNGVDAALGVMDQTIQRTQDTRNKVKESAKEATNTIDKACDELIQAVENRREALKKKCRQIAEGKDDVLSNQMVEVKCLRKNLSFAYLQATDAITNQSPEEMLSVKKSIEERLKRAMEAYQRQSMEIQEDSCIRASVEIRPLVKEIQKAGTFLGIPDPSKCHFGGMTLFLAVVGKERKINVVLKDEAEKPVAGKCHVQHRLRKVGEDPDEYLPPKVTVTQINNNDRTATLEFTPDQPGEYELTVMVRNRPITNPCRITARQSRDYSNFQNMKVTNKRVGGYCCGVAVRHNGTVYVSNHSNYTIKVFKPDGTESVIGSADNAGGQLYYPWGIVLIGETVYIVSYGNHMVKMYSTDGKFIGGFGGYGKGDGHFKGPCGICTDGKGRVLVTDYSNRRIQVFTSEGRFIKSFKCSSSPNDTAVDPVGNVHVALYDEHRIAVYSEDGKEIDSYNLGGTLRSPTAIYIDCEGNRLIGTASNIVHIADPTGTPIAARQVNGSCYGVAMDKNGNIYVSKYKNSCVSVYS